MADLYGYNPSKVPTTINSFKIAYKEVMQILTDDVQSYLIDGVGKKWFAKEAITFYTDEVTPVLHRLAQDANMCLSSAVDSMISAAKIWQSRTQTTSDIPSKEVISVPALIVDGRILEKNGAGEAGIDPTVSAYVSQIIATLNRSCTESLNKALQAVSDAGYLDVENVQQSNLTNSITNMKHNIQSTFNSVNTQLQTVISKFVSAYESSASSIGSAFSGDGK